MDKASPTFVGMKWRRILQISMQALTGTVFLFSALSKLPVMEPFGWTVVETSFLHWTAAEWAVRLLIGSEFFIGSLLLIQLGVKRLALPLAWASLLFYSVYLLLILKQYGNHGNCGCFGEWLPMTPVQSLLKNGALLLICFILQRHPFEWRFRFHAVLTSVLFVLSMALPFFVHPPESFFIYPSDKTKAHPLPLSLLYHSANNTPPASELRKGKHVLAFMSLTCRFCRKAAKRLHIMKEKHPELPLFLVLNGNPDYLADFMQETHAEQIDHMIFNGAEQFTTLNEGYTLPTIKWLEDTLVVRQSNYLTLDERDILTWLHK